jgi:hypothetical protein
VGFRISNNTHKPTRLEMATATITSAKPKMKDGVQNSFQSQNGTLYTCEVVLDNGTKGDVNQKTAGCKWNVGDTVEYEYTPNATNPKYNGKLKLKAVGGGSGYSAPQGGGSRGGYDSVGPEVGHAITSAIAILSSGGREARVEMIEPLAKNILDLSDRLKAERRAANAPAPAPAAPAAVAQPAPAGSHVQTAGKPELVKGSKAWNALVDRIQKNDPAVDVNLLKSTFAVSYEIEREIVDMMARYAALADSDTDSLPF